QRPRCTQPAQTEARWQAASHRHTTSAKSSFPWVNGSWLRGQAPLAADVNLAQEKIPTHASDEGALRRADVAAECPTALPRLIGRDRARLGLAPAREDPGEDLARAVAITTRLE